MKRYTPFILLLLAVFAFYFWVKPLNAKVETQRTELAKVNEEINVIAGERELIDPTKDNNASEIDDQMLKQAIPQGFDQDKIIAILKTLAEEQKISMMGISFNQSFAETTNQIKSVQMNISAKGNPSQVKAFITSLENNNRGFIINSIGLSYTTIEGVLTTTVNLNLESYFS